METCLQPREVVLDFGLLPLQVLCPQLETVAGVQAAHRSLAALAARGEDGNKYVTCSSVATVLDLNEQQVQLLIDTLAAVGGSSSVQQEGLEPRVNLHELSLFLLAQIYGREAHRPETQDHWPDPSSSGQQLEALKAGGGRTNTQASPGGNNSRLLIKAQLQALARQHAAYSRGYACFLERHQRVLLELILDDSSALDAWQQQRGAQVQQHKAAQQQLQQEQQQRQQQQQQQQQESAAAAAREAGGGGGDSDMTPVDENEGDTTTVAAMETQQEGPSEVDAASSRSNQQQQGARGSTTAAERTSSLLSSSSGSLASLGGSSFPPVNITAAEFDRLGLLLEAARISKAELAVLLESGSSSGSGSSGGGLAAGSSRSLFAELSSGGGRGGSSGEWLTSRISSNRLSSFVPGFFAASAVSMEECFNWMSSCWLHKMQQAIVAQHKAVAAAAAGSTGGQQGVSPLFQQPAFGGSAAGDAAAAAGAAAKQPTGSSSRAGGVASMLGDLGPGGGGGSSNVAAWLGMSGSPPNAAAQQLRALGSPAGLNASAATAGGGLGTFVGGLNGVPVVNTVSSSTGGHGPLTPSQAAAANAANAAAAAAGGPGASPVTSGDAAAAAAAAGTGGTAGAAGSSSPAAAAGGGGGAGLAGLISGPSGLGSIKVSTTRGMVAVAGGSVDDAGVSGVYRGTVVRGAADVSADSFTIQDCSEAHVYVLAPVKLARIVNCSDCNICLGAVSTLLRIERCERLQLTAAAGQVVVLSCHSCCLHLGTHRQPAILGDCRFVKLAPHNMRYETLNQHLAAAGIAVGKQSLWDVPLILSAGSSGHSSSGGGANSSCGGSSRGGSSCGGGGSSMPGIEPSGVAAAAVLQQRRPGASSPSSPHTHGGSSSAERRGGAATPKPVLLLTPEEFFPFVVPFRGTAGPLAGGVAHHASTHWQPNSHRSSQGPLPPFPFTLPPEYDAALQQQYGVVTELRSKIKGSGLDDNRRLALQNVIQSYFREWLHSTGNIRQVYDLSKLEGDEYGLSGGSPPAFRDTPSL